MSSSANIVNVVVIALVDVGGDVGSDGSSSLSLVMMRGWWVLLCCSPWSWFVSSSCWLVLFCGFGWWYHGVWEVRWVLVVLDDGRSGQE
jgi:hypothetical protein